MKGYRVIHNERVQGDHYIWTNNFDKIKKNNSLDQPEQVKDTECTIMKGYKVIHNEYRVIIIFGTTFLDPKVFFNI